MPALPTVTKTLRIGLEFSMDLGIGGCRFYYSYTGGPPNVTDLNTFCSDVATEYNSLFGPHYTSSYALTNVSALDLDTATGAEGTWVGSHPGSDSGVVLTAAICTVIDFVISRRYRGGKPRIYLPLGSSNDQDSQQTWGNTYIGQINAQWGSFTSYLSGLSFASFSPNNHVSVSYYSGYNTSTPPWRGPGFKYPPKLRTGPISPDNVLTHSTRKRIGTQRRRLSTPT